MTLILSIKLWVSEFQNRIAMLPCTLKQSTVIFRCFTLANQNTRYLKISIVQITNNLSSCCKINSEMQGIHVDWCIVVLAVNEYVYKIAAFN